MAASVLALSDPQLSERLEVWRKRQTDAVADTPSDEGNP
jgi:5-(carboxyamino)imidazole ribonucleotide mutase